MGIGKRLALAAVVALVLGLAAGTAAYTLEQSPEFCASCHEIKPAYETWLRSGFAEHHPTCIECHSAPGIAGIIGAQIQGSRELVAHFTGNFEQPIRAEVPDGWCIKCHSRPSLPPSHHTPAFLKKECADCHRH